MVYHGVPFVFKLYLVYFYNLTVWIRFIVLYLPVCVRAFVSVFEPAGLGGEGVYMMLHSAWPELCVLYVLLCGERREAVRHGMVQARNVRRG